MKTVLTVVGILLAAIGLLWTLQGANVVKGSFMTGSPTWLVIGIICLLAGGALVFFSNRRTGAPPPPK